MLRLKHKRTGEVRDVEKDSPEHRALLDQVVDNGGGHSESGWEELGEFDPFHRQSGPALGQVDLSGVGPEKHPERNLTQAEIDAGITSWEEKQRQLLGARARPLGTQTPGERPEDMEEEEVDSLTKDELKARLDERGISYSSKDTKDDLLAKLESGDAGSEPGASDDSGNDDNPDTESEEGDGSDAG